MLTTQWALKSFINIPVQTSLFRFEPVHSGSDLFIPVAIRASAELSQSVSLPEANTSVSIRGRTVGRMKRSDLICGSKNATLASLSQRLDINKRDEKVNNHDDVKK